MTERITPEQLKSIDWRFQNIYWIQDAWGSEIPFQEMPIQKAFRENLHYRNIVVKARQIGISTEIFLIMLDKCLFTKNFNCAVICHTLDDAKDLIEQKFMYAYERLPSFMRQRLIKDNANEKQFANGSRIRAGTSFRSGTLQMLDITEYAKICADDPLRAQEIKTGALPTLARNTICFIDSTAKGYEGHFHELALQARQNEGKVLGPFDWKFFFFPWSDDPRCIVDVPEIITDSQAAYFEKLEFQHGITLSEPQKWWYIGKSREQFDDMRQEYPSVPEEAFEQTIKGAYFEKELLKAYREQRIGSVQHDPALPVHTAWDIGVCAIWFFQTYGREIRLIKYHEDSGFSVDYYARMLRDLAKENNWEYGVHLGPHDLEVKNIMTGEVRIDLARKAGLDFIVVPRISNVKDGIAAAAALLNNCYFDKAGCERGISALTQYRRKWNRALGRWDDKEAEGWWNHACDAYRQIAQGLTYIPGVRLGPIQGMILRTARPSTLPGHKRHYGHVIY